MSFFYNLKQRLQVKWYRLKTECYYRLFLKKCGKGNIIIKPLFITLDTIILHNSISIWANARIEGIKCYEGMNFNPEIILHNHVSIQQNIHLTCATRVEIGEFTAIAANVTITDIHHPYTDISCPIEKQPIETQAVFIGAECKIYNNAVILHGTHIGKHCTVGANSVVEGIFPDYCIIVGSPARVVKRYSFEKQDWLKTDYKGNFITE